MRYLLDVNALIAFSFAGHQFHHEAMLRIQKEKFPGLLTGSITELGFTRVLAQTPAYGFTVASARLLLERVRQSAKLEWSFVADQRGIAALPKWVRHPKQFTDGHLLQLAAAHGAQLATFDRGIPGAYRIPVGVVSREGIEPST